MPEKKNSALRRRILPFTPLTLKLQESDGAFIELEFKLAFDMNAGAAIQEKTGLMLTRFDIWSHIDEPKVLKAMFWAALLAHQPEYNSEDGFEVVGTYIDERSAPEITKAIESAYLAYLPKERADRILKMKDKVERGEDNAPDPLVKAASSDGSSSGPLPDMTSVSTSTNSAA